MPFAAFEVRVMSQTLILKLLRRLKGRATQQQIRDLARKRYPDLSLHAYVGERLRSLQKWGIVDRDKEGRWYIVEGSV